MAEAERIIGTPDSEDAGAGAEPERADGTQGPEAANEAANEATGSGGSAESADAEAGTPAAEAEEAAESEQPKGRRKIAVLFAVAAVAYALDLISKLIVVAELEHHEPIELIGDWLKLQAIRNAGAAFGIGEAFTVIFTVIAAVVIVVIARLARKLYSLPWAIALGLLLGGALGNLTDRIFRAPGVFEGAVVDFIAPKGFAVFNLADSAIVCGGVLIVLLSFRGLDPDGTVHKD
ncbi:signal peptidase II [Streptomyces cavernicola]|uniref:Lipoprotein signal peptidase n=1 Tax=Streptomyces cavernicola TaxID=3043613 RepID=A0ABT6S4I7_9ACTN|nr:signal peptidase II [Streptomyces sp. B-S-A6]MDI3403004.1 signal peptidase II [Streptomyces sp. B-S-A6]